LIIGFGNPSRRLYRWVGLAVSRKDVLFLIACGSVAEHLRLSEKKGGPQTEALAI
jgi:hypothetical protein